MLNKETFLKWAKISADLKKIKAEEAALRKKLCSELFNNRTGEFKEVWEDDDIVVKGESKVTRNIDKVALLSMSSELTDEERECIKYTPELVLRPYRKLPEDSKLHEIITEKPAMPTLSLEFKM